jgi:beta-lactamase superfamily II metal-dependent hydrolase
MFKLHVIQAQCGDSLLLEFGVRAKPRYILIDGGPPGSYATDLRAALGQIVGSRGKLDLVVLSHIDNDHIVGILDLLAEMEDDQVSERPPRVQVAGMWHNSFERSIDPTGGILQHFQNMMAMAGISKVAMPLAADAFYGITEGNRLRLMEKKLKIPANKGFKDDLILVETAGKQDISIGPLKIRIAGPNKANLKALQTEWLEWLAETSEKMASNPAAATMADRSIPNLSSIVLLARCGGKTVLLTGDARGDHILAGLGTAKLTRRGKLHVDVLKVQHHGSDRNASRDFFACVTADTYVLSANGKYGNPDLTTLQWIVETAHDRQRPITLVVTNETQSISELQKRLNPATYGYTLTALGAGKHSLAVTLAE